MTSYVDEAYRLFEDAYQFFNERLFANELPGCLITFQRQARLMGYVAFKRWINTDGKTIDELAINSTYFANYPIHHIFQTLCHEMTHIWQAHFGKPSRSGYHNAEWAEKMQAIGLMPSENGEVGGSSVGQAMMDYIIEGGAFERACKELLEAGFKLKWYDAVQMPPPTLTVNHKTTSNVVALFRDEPKSIHDLDPLYKDFPIDLDEMARIYEEEELAMEREASRPLIQTSRATNKSNRHKYYCPRCFAKVWGKPSLNIMCLDCNQRLFEEV